MTLLELLGDILDGLRGPYGVTWASEDHSIAQTGYVFDTMNKAAMIAERGPWLADEDGHQVDGLCLHYPAEDARVAIVEHQRQHEGMTIWGHVETEDAVISEVVVTGGHWIYS